MEMKSRRNWVLIVLALAPLAATGQVPPLGSEFQVNTYTTESQDHPSVASAGNGSLVVVWSSNTQDGSGGGVFGQRYDSLGARIGLEFQVNASTTDSQSSPSVAAAPDGSFVVVWTSIGQDGSGSGIFGQRFGNSGAKVGSEFQVNTYTSSEQTYPKIAETGTGNFVVVWESYGQDGSQDGVFGQRFGAAGAKVGSEFQVSTDTLGNQRRASLASDGAGRFVVVWSSFDTNEVGIFGQRFDAAGAKLGPEFPINEDTVGFQDFPAIAADKAGNFLVAWQSFEPVGSAQDIFARRFNSAGEKLGTEFRVNTVTTADQLEPSVAIDRAGNFVVAWDVFQGGAYSIAAQRFDRTGGGIGLEFPVSLTSHARVVSLIDDGIGLSAVWRADDGSLLGVSGRRQNLMPFFVAVDARGIGPSDLNGVLEPGEAVVVEPAWSNSSALIFLSLTGTAASLSGPAATYTILDGAASYGSLTAGSFTECNDGSPGACYAIQISGPRPATHWDATLQENMSPGGSQFWKLHVGDSFTDVPRSEPFYKKIETLLHHGITSGCNTTQYCPGVAVPRDQMAIFVAKGLAGAGELIPSTGTVGAAAYNCSPAGHSLFTDVSPTDSFCKHVHYLAAQNVTLGCGATQYCPSQTITRDAMASFIAKALVAPKGGGAVPLSGSGSVGSYSCDAAAPNLHFADVPVSNPFCKHIHFLWVKGIVSGCSATQYCPSQPVNRDAMAKFIANGFGLQLYGP
jgi:hypothetical protein